MDKEIAAKMARGLMDDWGLQAWKFEFDWGMTQFGQCIWGPGGVPGTISLSRYLTPLNPEDEVRDVVLHEIAHALAGHDADHGWRWVEKAELVGATPERCYRGHVIVPLGRWKGTCPVCSKVSRLHSRPTALRSCGSCSPRRYDARFQLAWVDEGFDVTRVGRCDGRPL